MPAAGAGTSAPVAKQALVTLLDARIGTSCNVTYEPPRSEEELKGVTGEFEAVWVGDVASNNVASEVMVGTPLWVDEDYTIQLVIQVLKPDSDGTQALTDTRAAALLGELVGAICADPKLGIADTAKLVMFQVDALSWDMKSGFLPSQEGHGCRFDVQVRCTARLKLS